MFIKNDKAVYSHTGRHWVGSLIDLVFLWDYRWVLNSDSDRRSAKIWSHFLYGLIVIGQPEYWSQRLVETKVWTERSLSPESIW